MEGIRRITEGIAGHHPELIAAQDVFQAADRGDGLALDTLEEVASYLGIASAGLVSLFNPEVVFLGGPVGEASSVLTEKIREKVKQRALSYPMSVLQIQRSSLGADAGALGASLLVLQKASERFFRKPG